MRTARAQRNAARAHEDDASTKAEMEKFPYLALDDSTEHDVLEVLRDMGALNLVGMFNNSRRERREGRGDG